jgi:thiamine biosynthesis protein ThiS
MELTVNGEAHSIEANTTVGDLLVALGVDGTVAVERNGSIVRRSDQEKTPLSEGDTLEIVHFVGGG